MDNARATPSPLAITGIEVMAGKDACRLADDFFRAGMQARGHTKTEKSHLQIPLVLDPQAIREGVSGRMTRLQVTLPP